MSQETHLHLHMVLWHQAVFWKLVCADDMVDKVFVESSFGESLDLWLYPSSDPTNPK